MDLKRNPAETDVIKSAWFAFIVYPIGIFVFLIGNSAENNKPFIPIGIVGLLSASTVLITCHLNRKLVASIFTLIFWRSVCDLMISVAFLLMPKFQNYIKTSSCHDGSCDHDNGDDDWMLEHQDKCLPMSLWLEFFQIASESWLLCITYDLVVTISNPFTSLSYRIKYYHLFSWGVSFLMIFAMSSTNSFGVYYVDGDIQTEALCWIRNEEPILYLNRSWIFLLIPLIVIYSYAFYVSRYAREMLDPNSPDSKHSGLLKTHFHRLFALDSNTRTINIYVGYWIFLIISVLFLLLSVNTSHLGTHSTSLSTALSNLILLCIGAKGYVDLIAFSSILLSRSYQVCASDSRNGEDYFHLNKGLKLQLMTFITSGLKKANESGPVDGEAHSRVWTIKVKSNFERPRLLSVFNDQYLTNKEYCDLLKEVSPVEVEVLVSRDQDSTNRSHSRETFELQNNRLSFSFKQKSQGDSLLDAEPMKRTISAIQMTSRPTSSDQTAELLQTTEGSRVETNFLKRFLQSTGLFFHENSHEAVFEEYLPQIFSEIRKNANILEVYQDVFEGLDLEKVGVAESGASGAIFFFSRDNQFIAKSCTMEEMKHILSVASTLKEYFQENLNTLITQIYGVYRLQMYAAQIFFFVSRNVLWIPPPNLNPPLRVDIYDLKGSTYTREFKNPPNGTSVTCRHCGRRYRIGSNEMEECTSYRRVHEPTGVRKDNDFYSRLPLLEEDYDQLMHQVTKDLNFLSEKLQVMDYSWLVGISKVLRHTYFNEGERVVVLNENENIVAASSLRCMSGNYLSVMPSQQVIDGEWKYGIIDYQQRWNWRKRVEAWVKTSILGQKNISCASPRYYRDRQYRFIESTLKRISLPPRDVESGGFSESLQD